MKLHLKHVGQELKLKVLFNVIYTFYIHSTLTKFCVMCYLVCLGPLDVFIHLYN